MGGPGPDAVVVGSGPNGLTAAAFLAQRGLFVRVLEANDTIGGGARTLELTQPGFLHDICSAIHPAALASPAFARLPLRDHGLRFAHPTVGLAHVFDGGAAEVHRSVKVTAMGLGDDGDAYARLMTPLVRHIEELIDALLAPPRFPRHPLTLARLGPRLARSAKGLVRRFDDASARSLFAGAAAHSMLRLDRRPTAGYALMLIALAHSVGWGIPVGGSQAITDALASYLISLGGEIHTGERVASTDDLPPARVILFDVTPRQLMAITGEAFPLRYRRALQRFRYGPGVFKLDLALSGPVPWVHDACRRAGTVHVGGTFEEVAAAEAAVLAGGVPERPFVLVGQQSLFDGSRAPSGMHTLWAYCHVPNGCTTDMTAAIEAQIERFAPGFRDLIIARSALGPMAMEQRNANHVGGDINGGVQDLRQHLFRPVVSLDPYRTPAPGVFLCSSSTPPGGGVHGMCGYWAARSALGYLGLPI